MLTVALFRELRRVGNLPLYLNSNLDMAARLELKVSLYDPI
jgi:hypothetical protein